MHGMGKHCYHWTSINRRNKPLSPARLGDRVPAQARGALARQVERHVPGRVRGIRDVGDEDWDGKVHDANAAQLHLPRDDCSQEQEQVRLPEDGNAGRAARSPRRIPSARPR